MDDLSNSWVWYTFLVSFVVFQIHSQRRRRFFSSSCLSPDDIYEHISREEVVNGFGEKLYSTLFSLLVSLTFALFLYLESGSNERRWFSFSSSSCSLRLPVSCFLSSQLPSKKEKSKRRALSKEPIPVFSSISLSLSLPSSPCKESGVSLSQHLNVMQNEKQPTNTRQWHEKMLAKKGWDSHPVCRVCPTLDLFLS